MKRSDYLELWDFAAKMIDEAEGNILDAYAGTGDETRIRSVYTRKRSRLSRMRDKALGKVKHA